MAFQINKVKYSDKIIETSVGKQNLKVGGQSSYTLHTFEGEQPNKPKIAMSVWDHEPGETFSKTLREAFGDALKDPGTWAKKCVEFGADAIMLELKSSDPNDQNTGAAEAVANTEKVLNAVDVPVFVLGVENTEKDVKTLSAVAEKFNGSNLVLGPVTEANYKQVGAQALAYGHTVLARSPIDINLAKQLNILLTALGLSENKILIDPTTGGLGYGMEYCYSVMERMQMAALVQQDENLRQPIVNIIGDEIWKTKEASAETAANPIMGDRICRGVLMEVTQAVSMLLAGSSFLVLSHPESVKIVRQYIDLMIDGGAVDAKNIPQVPITDF